MEIQALAFSETQFTSKTTDKASVWLCHTLNVPCQTSLWCHLDSKLCIKLILNHCLLVLANKIFATNHRITVWRKGHEIDSGHELTDIFKISLQQSLQTFQHWGHIVYFSHFYRPKISVIFGMNDWMEWISFTWIFFVVMLWFRKKTNRNVTERINVIIKLIMWWEGILYGKGWAGNGHKRGEWKVGFERDSYVGSKPRFLEVACLSRPIGAAISLLPPLPFCSTVAVLCYTYWCSSTN